MKENDGAPLRAPVEEEVARAVAEREHAAAVTAILRGYGPEVLRFLHAVHRDEDAAGDVFSAFAETLLRVMPTFEGRSSARTWAYAIARRVSATYLRDGRRRAARFAGLPESSAIPELVAKVRTETLSFLRTERREKLSALRDSLAPEDQMLLMLRVDRGLSWSDLAVVLADGEGNSLSPSAQKRESARLRKRFQLLKERLRRAAREQGLIDESAGDS